MRRSLPITIFLLALISAAPALADWDVNDPYKWLQRPDLTPMGIDVNCSMGATGQGFILADDFRCTESGLITGVHLWMSWLNDYVPHGFDPTDVTFILSFHFDIPDSESTTGYSMPGNVIWYRAFQPGEFTARIWQEGSPEGWMNPPEEYWFPADYTCWQYNFPMGPAGGFFQEGTPDNPVVYWLDVQAIPGDPEARLGWKTSIQHWNDDAVWGIGNEPYFGPWGELIYPPNHEMYGQSIDLAFVIQSEAQPPEFDFGDAPDGVAAPGYPTYLANNGARHVIGGPWLGDASDSPDGEADGQADPNALGDDLLDGNDDEDGVVIPVMTPGQVATIQLEVNGGGGVVEAWIDWTGDQVWTAAEQVFAGFLADGFHSFNVVPPASTPLGQTFARFRISTGGGLSPAGPATDGEVEDYEVLIEEEQACKWIQRPDLATTGIDVNDTYPHILADDFLCTQTGLVTEIWVWASWMNDWLPFGLQPDAVDFTLSLHGDVPDSLSPTGYSMPADPLWIYHVPTGGFTVEVWRDGIEEGWMTPPDSYFFPGDTVCWVYKFRIPNDLAFEQLGTETEPIVYWLDVQAQPHDPDAWFGWKSSWEHWNDDAVWGLGPEPYFGPWYELIYPPQHPYWGESMDLAFLIQSDIDTRAPSGEVPDRFGLDQNVPNPFNPTTTIRFEIPNEGARATLKIYDVAGRHVRTLVDGPVPAGANVAAWNGTDESGRDLPSGVYFYRLRTGERETTRKMLLLK
ncbi:MAG: GEVED domain-containing protein [Candidatus Eisenbacteria bacterium]